MLTKEIFKHIKRIEIRTNIFVNSIFSGEYHSVFKGRGMEFSEVREYMPGDDIRSVDWNVTARMGRPYVKRFMEERELTVIFLVDRSGSGDFGSNQKMKNEVAAEVCALLAFSAIKNNDKVGLIVFTDQIELFIPPQKGRRHVLRVVREVLAFNPKHKKTNITLALDHLNRIISKKAIVFLISDFIDEDYRKSLLLTRKRHDLIAVTVSDPREAELPKHGLLRLRDAESGEARVVDLADYQFRKVFDENRRHFEDERRNRFKSMDIDFIEIDTNKDYIEPLVSFFRKRAKRLKRQG